MECGDASRRHMGRVLENTAIREFVRSRLSVSPRVTEFVGNFQISGVAAYLSGNPVYLDIANVAR